MPTLIDGKGNDEERYWESKAMQHTPDPRLVESGFFEEPREKNMGFLFDVTREGFEEWKNNPVERQAMLGEQHRSKCTLCPNVYKNSLPRIEIHWDGVCYDCACKCYPFKSWDTWEGILKMRQDHNNYWDALIERCADLPEPTFHKLYRPEESE